MRVNSAQDLAAVVRGRRRALGLSQAELATRAGVSRPWLSAVEVGKPRAEFGLLLRLLDALELRLDVSDAGDVGAEATPPQVDLDALLDDYRTR